MGGLKSNLIMIAVAILVLLALVFARRELLRALSPADGDAPAAQAAPAAPDGD